MEKRRVRKTNFYIEVKIKPKFKELKSYTKTFNPLIDQKNYLKNFKIVKDYTLSKYKISLDELEFIMFLYSEGIFDIEALKKYAQTTVITTKLFNKLIEKGFIHVWYKADIEEKIIQYEISNLGKSLMSNFYDKLHNPHLLFTSQVYKEFAKSKFRQYSFKRAAQRMKKDLASKTVIYLDNFK
jgi:hypothetical protein